MFLNLATSMTLSRSYSNIYYTRFRDFLDNMSHSKNNVLDCTSVEDFSGFDEDNVLVLKENIAPFSATKN